MDLLLSQMFYIVSTGGKPCWSKEFFYFENLTGDHIRDYKSALVHYKKAFPNVKIYYFRVPKAYPEKHVVLGKCELYCLFLYRFDFEKQILRRSYKLDYNVSLVDWAVQGLLYGYSREQIQSRYDQNTIKFPTLYSNPTLK